MFTAGCAGHAAVHMVPLGAKRIHTTGPLVVRVTPDECYFWVNDREELCVAMRSRSKSILGKRFDKEFLMSLVARGAPAGSGREYRMDRQTARVRHNAGFSHTRSASISGVLAVWDYQRDRLRGRFRFTGNQQSYSVLTDWTGNNPVLFVGEFKAVHHEAAGKELLVRTEEGPMARQKGSVAPKNPAAP